jgi:hypothetical protein
MKWDSLKEWTKVKFEPMVKYPPCIMTLEKGWPIWVFKLMAEVNNILHNRCKVGFSKFIIEKMACGI